LASGAKDFVTKPFDLIEVKTRIHNMLEVRLLYKKLEQFNQKLEQTVLERTAELRESEARFRRLTELSSDWYWEQDEHGHFTNVYGPVLEMLNTPQADSLPDQTTQTPTARWNETERAELAANIEARRPFLNFIYSRIHAKGAQQDFQVSGEPKFHAIGRSTGHRGVGRDVTEIMLDIATPNAA